MTPREYVEFLERYGLFLLVTTFSSVVVTVLLLFFVVTPMYQAETSLIVLKNRPGGVSSLLRQLEGNLDMLGSLQNLGIQANRSLEEDMLSILKSRSLALQVQKNVPLESLPELQKELTLSTKQEHFSDADVERYRAHQTYLFLQEQVSVSSPDSRNNTLRILAELSDPAIAAQLANAYAAELQQFMEKILNAEENEQLTYLKNQTEGLKKELSSAENALLQFQQVHDTVSLDEEVKQRIKALSELEAEALSAEAAYKDAQARQRSLKNSVAELAPESTLTRNALELDLVGLRQRKNSLRQAQKRYEASLKKLPRQGLDLARLQRDVALKNQLYLLLHQQTQAAELDQHQRFKAFRVLDKAVVPFEPAKPVKPLWVAVSAIVSFFLALLLGLFHQGYRHLKSETPKKSDEPDIISVI